MIRLLTKIFRRSGLSGSQERQWYGSLCSTVGIALNLILFGLKFSIGSLYGAVSVSADAFNNLSDSGSSIISLTGFKLASKKPDPKHPFGHGRIEYLSGLAVSLLIILMGEELLKTGIKKIITPVQPEVNTAVIISLCVSIAVKFYMFIYNRGYGKKLGSDVLKATATDSISDCISTSVVLISLLITKFTSFNIDGYAASAIALLILFAGIKSAYETIQPLLGRPPEKEFVDSIRNLVLADPDIIGIHDLIVHDYGPGRLMVSLHAEVSADGNILEIHDSIDNIERKIFDELNAFAVIHMDPIMNNDKDTAELKEKLNNVLSEIDPEIHFHDFRMVPGDTHTNLIFDIVTPFNYHIPDDKLIEMISDGIKKFSKDYYCVITVDKDYTGK